MSALKDELAFNLSKSTNVETSQLKMDRVFMIILLLNLGPDFENIREQILTVSVIPNFDEALARLLAIPPLPLGPCDLRLHQTLMLRLLSLILEVIYEVDMVATEIEDILLTAHTVTG